MLLLALGLPLTVLAKPIAVQSLAVLVDTDGSETITSVSTPEASKRFKPLDGLLSAGYTRNVHWLRFSVQAPATGSWWLEVMPPFLDDLRLFTPDGASFAERRSGDRLPFASREEDYRGFVFKLALADTSQHTYYLRLQTSSTSLLTLQLWQPDQFHAATNLEYTTIGLSFGFFLLMLLINLALWFGTREVLYGWFGLFVGAQVLFFFCFMGLASQYLLPLSPNITDAATGASVLIFLAVSPAFYRRMLHVERDQRLIFNVFRVMAVLPCLLLASLFTGHYPEAARMAQASSGLGGLLTLYLSFQLWRQGRQESPYLLLATALTPLTSVGGALLSLGLISSDQFTNMMQVQRWSPLVVTLSLQLALAVRLQSVNQAIRQAARHALLVERDRLRQEVQEHEARWTGSVDAIGEGIWEWDMASGEMLRSRIFDAALGYSEQDLPMTAEAWVELIHPDDLDRNAASLQNYLQGKTAAYVIEMRLRAKNTSYRWISCRGTVVMRDAAGAPTRMIGMHTDITERKEMEQTLAQQHQLLQDVVENLPFGMAVYDKNRQILLSNTSLSSVLGLPAEFFEKPELCFDDIIRFNFERGDYPEQSFDAVLQRLVVMLEAGKPVTFERNQRDGSWLEIRGNPLCDGGNLLTYSNITERKQQDEKLQRAESLLRASIETIGEGFVIFDADDHLYYCNQEYLDFYPTSAPIIKTGRTFEEILRYGIEHGQYPAAAGCEELWLAQTLAQHRQGDLNRIHQLDDGRWLRIRERRLSNGYTVGFRVDITELYRAKESAEWANLAKSRFLATMSHEIRTPMNAVLGMAQVLMTASISEAKRLDYARTIFNSGQTLLALLNDILDLSKIEAGKLELEAIALSPGQLMVETKALFEQTARAKGLSIEAQWSGPDRHYLSDPTRLRQMLSNLLSNAIKFTKQGSIRVEASEVACKQDSVTLEFSVADTGIGIAREQQTLLFQTFSQADSSTTRNYGGTGLGLSIVRTLAQAMGGEAGVQSEAGVGSRFWFRIEAELPADDALTLATPAVPGAVPDSSTRLAPLLGRVLVIEDNPINQEVIRVMLGQIGLEVALADDGQQALDALIAGERAQVILTDLQMPVMDGYTAAKRLREWEAQTRQKRRPIIALSADAYVGVRTRCLAAGMDDVLSKPVLHGDLWAALGKWLPAAPLAPQSAPTPAIQKTVDHEAVAALVNEIMPLLAHGKADALGRFKALQELVAGSALAQEIADADLPLRKFRFDLTLERLRQMAIKYEWRTTT